MPEKRPISAASVDWVLAFIYERFIQPARQRGQGQVSVHVSQIHNALSEKYGSNFIRAVLSSLRFRNIYELTLVAKDHEENEFVFGLKKDNEANPLPNQQATKRRSS